MKLFGLHIVTERRWRKESMEAFKVGLAVGRLEHSRTDTDTLWREVFQPRPRLRVVK